MHLKILVPTGVFADEADVSEVVAETPDGSFGLLPRRLDCVAALAPGILSYVGADRTEKFVAVDQGVLVKTGGDVLVSVRRAIAGSELDKLRDSVEKEFRILDEQERQARMSMVKLETAVLRRMAELKHE